MSRTRERGFSRRRFLKWTSAAVAAGAASAGGIVLFHFRPHDVTNPDPSPRATPKLGSWEDLYRQRWTWDDVKKGSHGWANCRSACEWDLYIKNGIVVREEQSATYTQSEAAVPDFNPRGCQKGACYTEVMYGPSRVTTPMKRVGPRGEGKWQQISWEQAIAEIAEKVVDLAQQYGTDSIYQDLGPNYDSGATTVGRFRFQMKAGGVFADNWAEFGDLNLGAWLTLGVAHVGGSSDEWFLSDFLVVWMMNPSVTQMPDAHFLYEARYNGAELVVVDPQYSATAVHADQWLPLRTGTDAALGLCAARHIWDSGAIDLAYVREQTDLPFLVRLDTGRFLRDSDLVDEGNDKLLQMWNPKTKLPAAAPGCEGSETAKLVLEEFEPPIEGTFSVTLKDKKSVKVATVGTLLREQLQLWTVEATAKVTGLAPELIERFAEGFAKAKRPMVLSSWGSNRFVHSDLMNRSKLLCLSLKGALGKRGAGYQATAFVDLQGFPTSIETDRAGLRGRLGMMAGMMSPSELVTVIADGVKKRRSEADITMGLVAKGEKKVVCTTTVTTMGYHYQGIKDDLNREMKEHFPRSLEDYWQEAKEKGWQHLHPKSGPPRVYFSGGSNLLRRTNNTQAMLDHMWPELKLVVALDKRMNFTGMHADYFLPAAGWYEKPGIKYPMAYAPYLHYCDAAVPPLGQSKDEWEVYWLLTAEMQRIAKERNLEPFHDCGEAATDYKELNDVYSFRGQFGPKDAEQVTGMIIDATPIAGGVTIAELKKKGIQPYNGVGEAIAPTAIFNPDWDGNGVLSPFTYFTEHKWRWPTQTGRQQYYVDHPWFIEAREALPTHRESPKGGGDHPFQLISCHARWSVHSTWRDVPLLLRLQRGEPVVYLNPKDAQSLAIADDDWAELHNDYGKIQMLVKHSTMVRPGVAYYFHAWEAYQFPDHKSYKWITPGLTNPLHFVGGERQLNMSINFLQPGTFVQDTRVGIRRSAGPDGDQVRVPASKTAQQEKAPG